MQKNSLTKEELIEIIEIKGSSFIEQLNLHEYETFSLSENLPLVSYSSLYLLPQSDDFRIINSLNTNIKSLIGFNDLEVVQITKNSGNISYLFIKVCLKELMLLRF
jgi:hypothetical protein